MGLRCRLFGHKVRVGMPWGGLPGSDLFGITAECRRCGMDMSIAVPSSFIILKKPRSEGR